MKSNLSILVSTSSFAKYDKSPFMQLKKWGLKAVMNPYRRRLTKREVLSLLKGKVGLLGGTEPIDRDVIDSAKELKVISRIGVGLDNIDLPYAKQKGILIFAADGIVTESVAELTIGLIIDCLRGISYVDRELRAGRWEKYMGRLLYGKTVGIIGMGNIGKRVAEILTKGFCCNVVYYDPYVVIKRFKKVKLAELLQMSDIISLHISGSTKIITDNNIDLIKKGAVLINTSRSYAVDEKALRRGIRKGRFFSVGLDVFWEEPYFGDLVRLENSVFTPHIGSYAKECRVKMEMQAVDNLIKGLRKKRLL